MSDAESKDFERDPLFPLYIKLREWDDRAKKEGNPLPPLNKYKDLALAHLLK